MRRERGASRHSLVRQRRILVESRLSSCKETSKERYSCGLVSTRVPSASGAAEGSRVVAGVSHARDDLEGGRGPLHATGPSVDGPLIPPSSRDVPTPPPGALERPYAVSGASSAGDHGDQRVYAARPADQLRTVGDRIFVVPCAVPERPSVPTESEGGSAEALRSRHGISGPFFLYVGNLHLRKNVPRLVEVFVRARRETPGLSNHQLVIAGGVWWTGGPMEEARTRRRQARFCSSGGSLTRIETCCSGRHRPSRMSRFDLRGVRPTAS
jgi:hypothetical protein